MAIRYPMGGERQKYHLEQLPSDSVISLIIILYRSPDDASLFATFKGRYDMG